MPGQRSNVELLTEGASYIQRAKRARQDQVETVKFDDDARREWLTGFSKRKKAKTDERRQRAKDRDRKEHLEERAKVRGPETELRIRNRDREPDSCGNQLTMQARKELKERAKANVRNVRLAMGLEVSDEEGSDAEDGDAGAAGGDDEEEGDENGAGPSRRPVREEQAYSDDDQLATVTITEDADFSTGHGYDRAPSPSSSIESGPDDGDERAASTVRGNGPAVPLMPASSGRMQAKAKKEKDRAKELKKRAKEKEERKKSKSMETSAERKRGRQMESAKRGMKAKVALDRDGKSRGVKGKRGGKPMRGGKAGRGRK